MFLTVILVAVVSAIDLEIITKWPWNRDHPAGMTLKLQLEEPFDGICSFTLPEPVSVFHINKGFVIPDKSDFAENMYTFAFPGQRDNLEILVHFHRMSEYGFGIEHIKHACERSSPWKLALYSFPNSLDNPGARSALRHINNFKNLTAISLVFPDKVKNFKVSDERIDVTPNRHTSAIYRLSNLETVNYHEVWFEFDYHGSLFDATQVQLSYTELDLEDYYEEI